MDLSNGQNEGKVDSTRLLSVPFSDIILWYLPVSFLFLISQSVASQISYIASDDIRHWNSPRRLLYLLLLDAPPLSLSLSVEAMANYESETLHRKLLKDCSKLTKIP